VTDATATARAFADAYRRRDRATAAALMAPDFRFTSPYDDALDAAAWFERCWPPGDRQRDYVEEACFAQGELAVLSYSVTGDAGLRFRNTELLRVQGGQVAAVTVFFGPSTRDGTFVPQVPG
jgi:ketosteroid isomerase-like protein